MKQETNLDRHDGGAAGWLCALAVAAFAGPAWAQTTTVTGAVTDGRDPIAGAVVCGMYWDRDGRVTMPEDECAVTGSDGAFEVTTELIRSQGENIGQVVAGAEGYLTTDTYVTDGESNDVALELLTLDEPDNPDYRWWNPYGNAVVTGCGTCHVSLSDQWAESRHALAAIDPWVLDMYSGTAADGTAGVGPGYRLDHDDAGPCAGCHAATASWEAGGLVDLTEVPYEHLDGVFCDTCHKIRDVEPNGAGGVDGSITMWRPDARFDMGDGSYLQFAFGPFPNAITHSMASSYSPLQRSARLCAGCHEWKNAQGVAVMDTYTDWLAVGDPEQTLPCQGCHMQNGLELPDYVPMEWSVDDRPDMMMPMRAMSGQKRDPATMYRHDFFDGIKLAPRAMSIELSADQQGNELVVHTTAAAIAANHRVPTGMPIREIILLVTVEPADGGPVLRQLDGPTIAPRGGDLAGSPGVVFAKSLGDAAGELTFAFWDATQTLEDTRLALGEQREDELRFAIDRDVAVTVRASLLYRRASKLLAEEKGWEVEDQPIGSAEQSLDLHREEVADAGPDGGTEDSPTGCVCSQPGVAAATPWPGLVVVPAVLLGWRFGRRSRRARRPVS